MEVTGCTVPVAVVEMTDSHTGGRVRSPSLESQAADPEVAVAAGDRYPRRPDIVVVAAVDPGRLRMGKREGHGKGGEHGFHPM